MPDDTTCGHVLRRCVVASSSVVVGADFDDLRRLGKGIGNGAFQATVGGTVEASQPRQVWAPAT